MTHRDSSLEVESEERSIPEIMVKSAFGSCIATYDSTSIKNQKIDPHAIEKLKEQRAVMEKFKKFQARNTEIRLNTDSRASFPHGE